MLYWEICNDDINLKNISFFLHSLDNSGDLGPDRGAVRGRVQSLTSANQRLALSQLTNQATSLAPSSSVGQMRLRFLFSWLKKTFQLSIIDLSSILVRLKRNSTTCIYIKDQTRLVVNRDKPRNYTLQFGLWFWGFFL